MSRTIIPERALELLRAVGDVAFKSTAPDELPGLLSSVRRSGLHDAATKARLDPRPTSPPISLDLDKLADAQRLFATYQTEILGALLLVALPQSYASEFGAGVLGASAELERNFVRRIRRTAQFLLVVMQRGRNDDDERRLWDCSYEAPQLAPSAGPAPDGPLPWQWCLALRMYHQSVRLALDERRAGERNDQRHEDADPYPSRDQVGGSIDARLQAMSGLLDEQQGPVTALLGPRTGVPLNQEDLLGMLLTFGITVFEVLERYGVNWTADEQDAYLHAWDVIGAYLGIGTQDVVSRLEQQYAEQRETEDGRHLPPGPIVGNQWRGLRPPTVDATRLLLEQIRARQWVDPDPEEPLEIPRWSSLRAGRILTRALLDELEKAMPRSLELLPIAVMRALLPAVVRKRLNLGDNGLWFRSMALLPTRGLVTERFTIWNAPNRVGASALRFFANDVTTRASVRFLDSDDYVLPAAGDWS